MTAKVEAKRSDPQQPNVVSGTLHTVHILTFPNTSLNGCGGLNENARIGSYICMLGSQLNYLKGLV